MNLNALSLSFSNYILTQYSIHHLGLKPFGDFPTSFFKLTLRASRSLVTASHTAVTLYPICRVVAKKSVSYCTFYIAGC